ncbi:MAG TPA: hypothetical protein PK771_03920 [Spirochaetota bacterium]|nr:hypothetical protein [Spirochaetota bacterium]
MKFEQRLKVIGFLEKTFIDESLEVFEKKNGKPLTDNEKTDVIDNWYNYSANFTRMWLNYMTDDKLIKVLNKKLENERNQKTFESLVNKN